MTKYRQAVVLFKKTILEQLLEQFKVGKMLLFVIRVALFR